MSLSLREYALNNFYPKSRVNNYPSKSEKWFDWLSSVYVNGKWYINEDRFNEDNLSEVLMDVTREIGDTVYIIKDTTNLKIGIKLIKFSSTSLEVIVNYNSDDEFSMVVDEYSNNYAYEDLPDDITWSNLNSIILRASEVVDNHIRYSDVEVELVKGENITLVSLDEFENKVLYTKNIQQKLVKVPEALITVSSGIFGLDLKGFLPSEFDSNQDMFISIGVNSIRYIVSITDNYTGFFDEVPLNNFTLYVTVDGLGLYSGYNVVLEFEDVNSEDYVFAKEIRYI